MVEISSKVNIKHQNGFNDVVLMSLSLTLTDSTHYSGVSIVDFKQEYAGWERRLH